MNEVARALITERLDQINQQIGWTDARLEQGEAEVERVRRELDAALAARAALVLQRDALVASLPAEPEVPEAVEP